VFSSAQTDPSYTDVSSGAGALSPHAVELFGLPCHAVSMAQAHQYAIDAVAAGRPRHVLFLNAAKIVGARTDPRLSRALVGADLIGADGQPLVWASRTLKRPIPERINGTNLMMDYLGLANERGWRVFFLGSTEEVLDGVERYCAAHLPGVVVAGRHNGFFPPDDDGAVADRIAATNADLLFVGMPSPRKEYWLDAQTERAATALAVAVGGSYEILAGNVRRAPVRWQGWGLEWLWRLLQEPRRLGRRYLTTNSAFLRLWARELLRQRTTGRRSG
jgi:N-acetylglucosaminyldiphosphoundecaprenol N-acetyl-beta-D-mannosaminyltransferase